MRVYISGPITGTTDYMLRGWENSRGAVKEYYLAMAAGMVVLKEEPDAQEE